MTTETRSIHTFQEGELFDSRYRLVKRAGSGGFADVWKAEDTLRKNKVVALKIYTRLDEEGIKAMSEEYNETEDIQHPNLLTGNHFAAVGNIPYMEMRYCDGGSLASRVGNMSNDELRHMLRDVCTGLSYLHAEGMVHQDIKPENILLDTKHNRYMLADFGISGKSRSRLSKSAKMASDLVAMTAAYAPPEKLSSNPMDREPSTKGDIFSLGVTLYELATGNLPVDLPQSTGQLLLISEGRQPLYFDNIADPQLRQIAKRCMSYRKEDRPTAEDVLAMLDGRRTEPQFKHESTGNTGSTGGTGNAGNAKRPTERIKVNGGEQKPVPPKPSDSDSGPSLKEIFIVGTVIVALFVGLVIVWPRGEEETATDPISDEMVVETPVSEDFTVGGVSFTMVYVEGGTFTMGCTSEQGSDCYGDEKPVHSVTLSDYYIGQTEVTQALWKAVMGSNPSRWKGDNLPVEYVSYNDVTEFIGKLNRMTGRTFRLPTEAEWEYAARGGKKSRGYKYSGSSNIGSVAWYYDNSGQKTHSVAQKQANELGLYDMSGNVWEWCADWYGDYSGSSQTNPKGPSSGSGRVLRGGRWGNSAGLCRVSNRNFSSPSYRDDDSGFRLALSL